MNFYFSHDYNARNDRKLQKLLMKKGLAGIGLFWCLVEMLFESGGNLSIKEYERISFELRCDITELQDVIENFELFQLKDEKFYSKSVLKRLKLRKEKSDKAKQSISKRWDKYKENKELTDNTNVERTYNERDTFKSKKNKKNELQKKVKDGDEEPPPTEIVVEEHHHLKLTEHERNQLIEKYGLDEVINTIGNIKSYSLGYLSRYESFHRLLEKWLMTDSKIRSKGVKYEK